MGVDALIRDLESESADVRERAATELHEHPDPHAIDALVGALSDSEHMVRRMAALALGKIGDTTAVSALMQQARQDQDGGSRSTAVSALGDIGDPAALEPLQRSLADADASVRAMAAQALGKLGDIRATAALLPLLGDRMYGVRGRAIDALAALADPISVEPLARYYWKTEGRRRGLPKAERTQWNDALQAWSESGNARPLRMFLAADPSREPIVRSIQKVFIAVDTAAEREARIKADGAPKRAGPRPWWKFWGKSP